MLRRHALITFACVLPFLTPLCWTRRSRFDRWPGRRSIRLRPFPTASIVVTSHDTGAKIESRRASPGTAFFGSCN